MKTTYAMSRRRRSAIFVFFALLAGLLVWLDHSPVRNRWQRQPKSEEQIRAYDCSRYHSKTFMVVNVVDGDTIDIDIPDGEDDHTRIRLWGIDTPETNNPEFGVMYFGREAAVFTHELTFGKQVHVYLDIGNRSRGKYGRLLAYVQLPDERFLNEVLVAEGFAYADLRFRHSLYHKYEQLEASARTMKNGLWREVSRPQLPEWLQRIKPNLLQ